MPLILGNVLGAMGQKPIGSGAIGTAPPPASVAVGSLWVDGAVVYQNKYVFKNAGTDFISLGRPQAILDLLDPSSKYIVKAIYKVTASCPLFGLVVGLGKTPNIQMHIATGNSPTNRYFDTGTTFNGVGGNVPVETYSLTTMETTSTNMICKINGSIVLNRTRGSFVNVTNNIQIGGSDATGNPLEGNTAFVGFYTSAGALVDMIDFNDQTLWDGGLTGTTWAGNPFTITDGSPTGVRVLDWVPINL